MVTTTASTAKTSGPGTYSAADTRYRLLPHLLPSDIDSTSNDFSASTAYFLVGNP